MSGAGDSVSPTINWRMEGTDEQGRTRFVEYARGEYRADPETDGALRGEDLILERSGPDAVTGDPRGGEWHWFRAGRWYLEQDVGLRVTVTGSEPEFPLEFVRHSGSCGFIDAHDPMLMLINEIYQVFRRTRNHPLKDELPPQLFAEVGWSFVEAVRADAPGVVRRCRALQWMRMQDTVEAEDPSLAEEFGEPADPAETDLVARGPRVYLTETRNLLRPVVIARLGDALRTKLPADTAEALDAAVAAALTARDMSWPREYTRGLPGRR